MISTARGDNRGIGAIAYIVSRFPHLPETFILREMEELERQGWPVRLYPLIQQQQAVRHTQADRWHAKAQSLPFVSRAVIAANAATGTRHPGCCIHTFVRGMWENRADPNMLARAMLLWPKAVYAARLMQQEGVRHIHAHYATHPAFVAWVINRLTGIPYSVTVHAHDIFVRKTMLALKMRDARFIVAISGFNRDYLAQQVGESVREKTHVIHCGVVPENYTPRRDPLVRGDRFEVVNIGSLQPYKGQRYLIDACALLRERGVPVHCRIIGGGELRRQLEHHIDALRLRGVVELLGPRPEHEVARLLPTAHCYAMPSIITPSGKMEGIPVSIMEAMACAVPVVASDLSGIPELVRPEETGLLVPPANAAALAEALARMWQDSAAAGQMAKAGGELVLREFDLRTNVRQLAALFEASVAGA